MDKLEYLEAKINLLMERIDHLERFVSDQSPPHIQRGISGMIDEFDYLWNDINKRYDEGFRK